LNKNKNYRIMKFFESSDKSCTGKGYVKLDMRGNRGTITVNVENLGDAKESSEVFLFKNKEEKIKIGPINNKRGKLQKNILLNGKDEPIENFNICGIVNNGKVVLYTPVFISAQVKQLNVLLDIESDEDIIDKKAEVCAEKNFDDEGANNKDECECEESYNDECVESNAIKGSSYYQTVQNTSIPNRKTVNERIYKNEYEKNLFDLLEGFENINPLANDIKSIKWWKVIYDEGSIYKGFLPYFNQIISTYYPYPLANHVTTCQYLMQKHGYYLFGIYNENNNITKFVYGIPGKFTRDEQPYKGVTGFKNWSYKNNNLDGDYGFWLAFIDAKTGTITEPPNVE
jgi:hypothetical protein